MTGFSLRVAALLTMIVDHCTDVLQLPQAGRWIGRISFPLYAMMLLDSFRHLKDHPSRLKRYLVMLSLMAIVSEPLFDYSFYGQWYAPVCQNQLLQYLTVLLGLMVEERLPGRVWRVLLWVSVITLNEALVLGYSGAGVILMLLLRWYLCHFRQHEPLWRIFVCTAMIAFFILLCILVQLIIISIRQSVPLNVLVANERVLSPMLTILTPTLMSAPFLALYNGEYGAVPGWFRKVYRVFYPAHLAVLAAIRLLVLAG